MAESIQAQRVGNYSVTLEVPKSSGKFFHAVHEWAGGAGGAYDMMNMMKKLAVCAGRMDWAHSLGAYTAATAVPRLPCATYELYEKIVEVKDQGMTPTLATKLTHGFCEVGAMSMFTINFFNPANTAAGNAGMTLNALSDACDVGTYALEAQEANQLLSKAQKLELSGEVQDGLSAKRNYSLIKLAKAISSSVTGFFSTYALATGAILVGAGTALALGLASSILTVSAYFYKNCYSNYFAKVEVAPLKI